jgi:NitT/TauT family transport system permease protein
LPEEKRNAYRKIGDRPLVEVVSRDPGAILWRVGTTAFEFQDFTVTADATRNAASAPSQARRTFSPQRHLIGSLMNWLAPLGVILAVLIAWALLVRFLAIPDYLLPAPQAIAARIVKEWPLLQKHGAYTLLSVLTGFAASIVVGVPLAFAIVISRGMERAIMPFLVMSQTIPKVAIAPILVVWLGFGILPKIAIVFLISFFPIVVSTVAGLKSVESDMIDLVRSMGAGTPKIMLRVRGPSALPQMFAGLKIAVCLAVVGAVVGEFVGSDRGLGFLLLTSTGTLDGTLVWAALVVLIAMGVILFALVAKIERLVIPWHVSMRADDAAAYQS